MDAKPPKAQFGRQIYDQLKADISAFRFKPGEPLAEQELAARYGGSRTPVREAVRRLHDEGLMTRRGRRYAVATFDAKSVKDLYELREALEKMAVRLAIERATDADIETLVTTIGTHRSAIESGDFGSFNELDSNFHIAIAHLSGNPLLEQEIRRVHDKVKIVRIRELSHHQGFFNAMADHRRILGAMLRRDIAIAEAEMRYHVRSVIALYHGYKEPRPTNPITDLPLPDWQSMPPVVV